MTLAGNEPAIFYLDNAATSFPKPEEVYAANNHVARTYGANPGRGGHKLAHEAAKIVLQARLAVADFFAIKDCGQIIFTANATEAINIALFGILEAGDRVVTTSMEHNSVSRPLHELQCRGVNVVKVPCDQAGRVDQHALQQECLAKPTKLVVMTHCSNVTGTTQPISAIGNWCRQHGILFMVDAAQSAGVLPIDVEAMAIDMLAAPGHKSLLGPQGTGFLYASKELKLKPLKFGGTGTMSSSLQQPDQLPDRLECGTLNTAGLAALTAGIEWIKQQGVDNIRTHEQFLVNRLREGLSLLPAAITLYGPESAEGGVLSFSVVGFDPSEIGFILDQKYNIAVRVGLHCAPDAHNTIGSFPQGTIRVSPGIFNTAKQIDYLLQAINEIIA
ncbi:MAG: aminotransferase class V-fold PLP-dependent enzyme [Desulfuromonas sp.]|nr:aminotransferase class V-fold PLP-dependent enzyme [Desulfuromonas sp.]